MFNILKNNSKKLIQKKECTEDCHDHGHHHHSHGRANPISFQAKIIGFICFIAMATVLFTYVSPSAEFEKGFITAKVVENLGVTIEENDLFAEKIVSYKLQLASGEQVVGEQVLVGDQETSPFKVGEKVVVNMVDVADESSSYQVVDKYRLNVLLLLFGILLLSACAFVGWNSIFSFLGLGFSLVILIFFIVKGILAGYNPLLVTILGSFLIATVSVYLGHGFNKRTSIAILGIISTLTFVGFLSVFFVYLGGFLGLGSEEAFFLQLDSVNGINLKGILLAGIIIGTLGVLDDVTTAQVAVVSELKKANLHLSKKELYASAVTVGKEHITSLINTLVLAYAGASMPLFILFVQDGIQPIWSLLNGEFIAEEVLRTLAGSIALVLSVPFTTWLAVKFLKKD
jgi:uncharacterized membrane protein